MTKMVWKVDITITFARDRLGYKVFRNPPEFITAKATPVFESERDALDWVSKYRWKYITGSAYEDMISFYVYPEMGQEEQ